MGIQITGRRMSLYLCVHLRLSHGRFVGLVVPTSSITDQIYNHIALKCIPEIHRQLSDKNDCLRVIGIYVEDWRLHHLGNVGAVLSRPGIVGATGCKTDLIINDYVQSSACAIAPCLGHLKCLHHHTLSGEGGITMDHNRNDRVAIGIFAPILSRPYRPLDHRGDNFQMRGIECQRQMQLTTRRHHVR